VLGAEALDARLDLASVGHADRVVSARQAGEERLQSLEAFLVKTLQLGHWLGVVVDRPKSPGNLGSIVRTATSFDAAFLITTGHAADPFDPACVRASVGTLFDLPLVLLPSHAPLLAWVEGQRVRRSLRVVGTGQAGSALIDDVDLRGNVLLLLGNETEGLSSAYRGACDVFARLPTGSRQPSLNVAAAAAILLYEARRQRGAGRG